MKIVTLTTDFGSADHYVATMKGVLLTLCPQITLVDITHQVPPFSVLAGGYQLAQSCPFFPADTVHLVVVDPGVGTQRRAIIVESEGHLFVAPDNGVLSMALAGRPYKAVEIEATSLLLPQRSETFHGRDVFAPVAAQLACGASSNIFGNPIEQLEIIDFAEKQTLNGWQGIVLSIDRFGNIITNFSAQKHSVLRSSPFTIRVTGTDVERFYPTFGAAPPDSPFAYFGSSGYVEIGMNGASAASALAVDQESVLHLIYQPAAGN